MPVFQPLAPEEFKVREKGPGKHAYLAEYQEYLSTIEVGGGGTLTATAEEKKATIKNRLNYSARTLGMDIHILRADSNSVKFQVTAKNVELDTEDVAEAA